MSWSQLIRILVWEGDDVWASGNLFKALVQAIFLFGLEKWVATPQIIRTLEGFHHRAVRQMTGKQPQSKPNVG